MRNKMLKRIAAAVITGSMLLSSMTALAAEFPDVKPGSWYYNPVQFVSDAGIMRGYANGRFGPSDNVTRGQFVTTLYRMEGEPETAFEWGVYSDVVDGKFYSIPSIWSYYSKAMTGYADGRFGVNDNITREQVATVLYRYASTNGFDVSAKGDIYAYPDGGRVSSFARDGLGWTVGAGIITGTQGNLDPQGKASRAQIATIFNRFLAWAIEQAGQEENPAPEEHQHTWATRTVVDQEAVYEEQPVYEMQQHWICGSEKCGEDMTLAWESAGSQGMLIDYIQVHMQAHLHDGSQYTNYYTENVQVQTGTNRVLVTPEQSHTETYCTVCGEVQ